MSTPSTRHMLARLKRKLPHASLAAYLSVDARTLGRWLQGRNKPLPIYAQLIKKLHDTAFPHLARNPKSKSLSPGVLPDTPAAYLLPDHLRPPGGKL